MEYNAKNIKEMMLLFFFTVNHIFTYRVKKKYLFETKFHIKSCIQVDELQESGLN